MLIFTVNRYKTMYLIKIFMVLSLLLLASTSWAATKYVEINKSYSVPIPGGGWKILGYHLFEFPANATQNNQGVSLGFKVKGHPAYIPAKANPGQFIYRTVICINEPDNDGNEEECRTPAPRLNARQTGDLISVYGAPIPLPRNSVTVNKSSITEGESYTVRWSTAKGLISTLGEYYLEYRFKEKSSDAYSDYTFFGMSTTPGVKAGLNNNPGYYQYRVKACNSKGVNSQAPSKLCSAYRYSSVIRVKEKNVAPIINPQGNLPGAGTPLYINEQLSILLSATDTNSDDSLTFSLLPNIPSGMALSQGSVKNRTAQISWKPAAIGTYTINYQVSDKSGAKKTDSFTIKVIAKPPTNRPPVVSASIDKSLIAIGETVTISANTLDLDNNLSNYKLCYNIVNSTGNCTKIFSCPTNNADKDGGVKCSLAFTPTIAKKYYIWAQATDAFSKTAKSLISTLTVKPANEPPTVTIKSPFTNSNYNQGSTITLRANAQDKDGHIKSIQFFASGVPIGSAKTGSCSGPVGEVLTLNTSWSTNIANIYNITAEAVDCDSSNPLGNSASVQVRVNAITAPSIPSVKGLYANNKAINTSTTGIYQVRVNPVSGANRYRLYENGVLIANLSPANLSHTVTNASKTYTYCARAANRINGITRWSNIGKNSQCKSIVVKRPRPVEPSFSPIALQQTGAFTLAWPSNANTTSYQLKGKAGGIDSTGTWQLIENTSSLSYAIAAMPPGLNSFQLSACNSEGCTIGQQLTINTLTPYVEKAELDVCGVNCLRLTGIGFDQQTTITLASQAENTQLANNDFSVNSAKQIDITMADGVLAAIDDLGVRINVTNPNQSSSSLLFARPSSASKPSLVGASIAVGNNGTIYATANDQLLAVDMFTGEHVIGWPQQLDGISVATPTINSTNGDIYVGTLNKKLHAFNSSGESLWTTQLRGAVRAGAVLDETPLIYQGAMDAALYAINTNGQIEWQYPVSAGIAKKPVLYGNSVAGKGLIYVTSEDAQTHIINRKELGPYALRWPKTEDIIMCLLPFCDELATTGWQPAQDEIRNGQLFTIGRLFYAILGRSPGERELTFWAWALLKNASHQEIVNAFLQSPQGVKRFPPTMTNGEFLRVAYGNMFFNNWPEHVSGLSFNDYIALLDAGNSRAEILLKLTNSLEYGGLVDQTLHQVFFYLYDHCTLANGCVFFGDSDGDGISDEDEVANGLDPLNPYDVALDPPTIEATEVNDQGEFTLSWTEIAAASVYQIQQAYGQSDFSTLAEQPSTTEQKLKRDPNIYRYKVRACITGTNNFLHCGNNYSNTIEVRVGQDIEFTIDYPLAETPHAQLEPLEVSVSSLQTEAISRVKFALDDQEMVISADFNSPYRYNFGELTVGEHKLTVIVEDITGIETEKLLDFTVSDGTGNPEIAPLISKATPLAADPISDTVGLTAGNFRVDESGAATYSIPLTLPQGIAGIQPSLALNYHSSAGNSTMGIGWQVSGLSSISRCRQTWEQDGNSAALTLTNQDRFCLDGQKLKAVTGSYGENGTEYRTEIASKTRIYSYGSNGPEYFKVQREDGSTSWYGSENNQLQAREDALLRIDTTPLAWLLNSSTDNMGNTIEYHYQLNPVDDVSENDIVIKEINYSGNKVTFNYAGYARKNVNRQYVFGTAIKAAALLNNIVISSKNEQNNDVAIRSYIADYQAQTNGQFDRINSISECDGATLVSAQHCLPPTTFQWHNATQEASFAQTRGIDLADDKPLALSLPFDLDSDGFSDMVYLTKDGKQHSLYVAYNENGILNTPKLFNTFSLDNDIDARLIPVDLNGDGLSELIFNQTINDQTYWRYIDVHSQQNQKTCGPSYKEQLSKICHWKTLDYSIKELGFTYQQTGKNLILMDVNSDAYPDIVYYHNNAMQVAINKGIGFNTPKNVSIEKFVEANASTGDHINIRTLAEHLPAYDFNGDGIADLMVQMANRPAIFDEETDETVLLNSTIYTWVAYQLLTDTEGEYHLTPIAKVPNSDSPHSLDAADKIHVSDINGDGLGDVLYRNSKSTSHWQLYYATGNGFAEAVPLTINSQAPNSPKAKDILHIQYRDVTYDGRADIVFFNKSENTPLWQYLAQTDEGFATAKTLYTEYGYKDNQDQVLLADWDGDGIIGGSRINHITQTLVYRKDGITQPQPTNRIYNITNGFGLKTNIDYSLMTDPEVYTKGQQAETMRDYGRCQLLASNHPEKDKCSPIFDVISPSFLVKTVTSDAPGYQASALSLLQGASATLSVHYHYQNLRIQSQGRGSLGFELISTYDPQKDVTTTSQYHQNWPYIGMPRQSVSYLGERQDNDLTYDGDTHSANSSIVASQRLSYAKNTLGHHNFGHLHDSSDYIFPYIAQSNEESYRINSANLTNTALASSTVTTNTWLTTQGYPQLQQSSVETTDADSGDTQTKITTNEFQQETIDTEHWWLNRVTATEVEHQQTDKAIVNRRSEFSYNADNGLLDFTIVEPELGCDKYLKTSYGYDTYGNRNSVSVNSKAGCDASLMINRSSTMTYHHGRYLKQRANNRFTEQTVNSFNILGQATQMTDANQVKTYAQFGRFGQPYHTYNDTGAWQKVIRRWASNNQAPTIHEPYHFVEITTSATKPPQWRYFDQLARPVATVTKDITGMKVYRYTRYDRLGNTLATSLPRNGNSMNIRQDFTLTHYDKFDRVIASTTPDGTSNTLSYNDNELITSTTFNRNGAQITQQRKEIRNAFGQSEQITDNLGGIITYGYDVLGNLKTVTNNTDSSIITTEHDKLGRKLNMTDPSKGYWSYRYNALGELTSQTDAKLQITTNTYDNIGRKTQEVIQGIGNRQVSWHYSGPLLTSVNHSEGTQSTQTNYQYDSYARVKQINQNLNGQEFTQRTTYDQHGRVFQQFDASGGDRGLRYHYRNGYVSKIQEAREGLDGVYYQQNNAMDAFGHITLSSQGNGIVTSKKYDTETGYLKSILAKKHSGLAIQNAEYNFDNIGNLQSRTRHTLQTNSQTQINGQGHNVQQQTFSYDALNRLTHVNDQQQIAYQANGNIEWKFDALNGAKGYYCYSSSSPHAVTGLSNSSNCTANDHQYDNNGNMTTGRTGNIAYNAFDKPTLITSDTGSSSFAYGANRSRYKRVDIKEGITTTTYYAGNVEIVSKSDSEVITFRRNLPGAIALVKDNGAREINYLHKDHLGSLDTITNDKGEIKQKLYFDAWGKKVVLDSSLMLETLQTTATPLNLANVLDITPRGFTGHEHVDHADIIHMNGRIYDPTLGRFLQADPHIQAPKNSQSYNRYAYVLNNPLSYTDPSGFFFKKLLRSIAKVPILNMAVQAVLAFYCQVCLVAYNAASTYAVTGSLKAAFTSAAVSIISPGGASPGAVLGSAVIGGLASKAQGGKFGHGFVSAGLGAALGGRIKTGNAYMNVFVSAVIGGTVSKLTGGKFANGAQTWAFSAALRQDWGSSRGLFNNNADVEKGYQQSVKQYGSQDGTFELSDDLSLDYTVSGSDGFAGEVAGHISELSKTTTGNQILTGMAESGNSLAIFENIGQSAATGRGLSDFTWGGTIIALDPNSVRAPVAGLFHTTSGRSIRPFVSSQHTLGHELVHAWQNTSYFNGAPNIPGNVTGGNPWERQAAAYTNRIRSEQGSSYRRTRYD